MTTSCKRPSYPLCRSVLCQAKKAFQPSPNSIFCFPSPPQDIPVADNEQLSLPEKVWSRWLKDQLPTQIHSAKTHHRAVRSASTSPLQTPRSEHFIMVSQVPPS